MAQVTTSEVYTPNQKRLIRIATVANIFVWIVFAINFLFIFGKLGEEYNLYLMTNLGHTVNFWKYLFRDPIYTASIFVDMLTIFVRGVVYALVLKGIAVGLNMIVEIDMNNKERAQAADSVREASHE